MKKIGIIIAVVLALLGGAYGYLAFAVVDEDAFAQEMQTRLATAFKREVTISRVEGISLFPSPHLVVHGVQVKNAPEASKPEWVFVPQMRVAFPWGAFVKGDVSAYNLTLVSPSVQLEVLPQGVGNWASSLGGLAEVFGAAPVEVQGASVVYMDAASGVELKAENVSGTITPEVEGFRAEGQWQKGDDVYDINASWKAQTRQADGLSVPFEAKIASARESFAWQGEVARLDARPQLKGKFTLEAQGISPLLQNWVQLDEVEDKRITVRFSADSQLDSRAMVVRNGQVEVLNEADATVLKGMAQWNYLFGSQAQLHWSGAMDKVDADFFLKRNLRLKLADAVPQGVNPQIHYLSGFLKSHSGTLQGYAKEVTYNGQKMPFIQWQADFTGGEMQVKQLVAALPANGQIKADGVVSHLAGDLIFLGKWEGQGDELSEMLHVIWPRPANREQPALGRFAGKSNIAWDKEQLRLSEFQARVADTRMGGALVFEFEERLKVESFMRMVDVDVDKALQFAGAYVETLDNKAVVQNPGDLFEQRFTNHAFDWVNALGFDVVASLSLQNYTFLERKGKRADFTLRITSNSLGLEQLRADYAGYQMGGDVSLTLRRGESPLVRAQMVMNNFDAKEIFPELMAEHDDKEWDDFLSRPVDLKILQLYGMDLDLSFGRLKVRELVFDDLRVKANVENGRLTFDEFTGKLWDGMVNVRFVMQAAAIPTMAMSFSMENMSLVKMAQSSRMLSSMAGLVRITGELATSGAVMRTWLTNAKGELRIDANDLSIRGVGISTLSRAVPSARQVKDIVQAGRQALSSGITRISDLEGFVNIEGGKARSPRIVYNAPESTGTIEGEVDMVKEEVNILMQFYLLNTVQEGRESPMLKLMLQGEIDNIKKHLDTQELENYVSQAAAARALRNR